MNAVSPAQLVATDNSSLLAMLTEADLGPVVEPTDIGGTQGGIEALARTLAIDPAYNLREARTARRADRDRLAGALDWYERLRARLIDWPAADADAQAAIAWIVENPHWIRQSSRDVAAAIRSDAWARLPRVAIGAWARTPRVVAVAHHYLANSHGRLDLTLLGEFLHTFQRQAPLRIRELWSLAPALGLAALRGIATEALAVARAVDAQVRADQLADELADATPQHAAELLDAPLSAVANVPAGLVRLAQRLREHGAAATRLATLARACGFDPVELEARTHAAHTQMLAANNRVRELFGTLRSLQALDWQRFVEAISPIDAVWRNEPAFARLDAATRERYRDAVADLATAARVNESEIAAAVLARTQEGAANSADRELGYHLIGGGRCALETALRIAPSLVSRCRRHFFAHALGVYLWLVVLGTLAIAAVLFAGIASTEASLLAALGIAGAALIPASDMVRAVLNRVLVGRFPPRHLPRLDLSDGIPTECRTLVVIPALVQTLTTADELLARLEVHFYASGRGEVSYALLTDWQDSEHAESASDSPLHAHLCDGVMRLNARHGAMVADEPRFALFHRQRRWNERETCWMGWERKRGKLHELNRLLRGATDTSFLEIGEAHARVPAGVRYVLTLDADTELPYGALEALVGAAAHPLNRPIHDPESGRVVQGHAIFQPRVTATTPRGSAQSYFRRLFAGAIGWDPYAAKVSDLYQDVFGEGSFVGKGLYDVDAFERALLGRIPENLVLSHDLLEGLYARAAYVNDIEVFDDYPSHAEVASARNHRWARGDWQLISWIIGSRAAQLPGLARWRLVDNLRRTLHPIALLALTLGAFLVSESTRSVVLGFCLASVMFAPIVHAVFGVGAALGQPGFVRITLRELTAAIVQSTTAVAFLAQQAWLMVDAIMRTSYRLVVSGRHRLEWVTAAQAKQTSSLTLTSFPWMLESGAWVLLLGTALISFINPPALPQALPLLALWWLVPIGARWLSRPPLRAPVGAANAGVGTSFDGIARATWLFFERYVDERDHHLPPDNVQWDNAEVIAHRTSPSNIGLYLLSVAAAREFGWLGLQALVARLERTLDTVGGLTMHRGHLLNWYDTRTLEPLVPAYVSTVDSGNLAGHLLTLSRSLMRFAREPLLGTRHLHGARTTVRGLREAIAAGGEHLTPAEHRRLEEALRRVAEMLADPRVAELGLDGALEQARRAADLLTGAAPGADSPAFVPIEQWTQAVQRDLAGLVADRALVAPLSTLTAADSLTTLASVPGAGGDRARSLLGRIEHLAARSRALAMAMDFKFLFDRERCLFAIGYRIDRGELDDSRYDLLASEARLASLVAIAKHDVPATHWLHLGRPTVLRAGAPLFLAWGGSMFEYLMSDLIMDAPPDSALGRLPRIAIGEQMRFARTRMLPWGVSESAYNARDRDLNYQYANFGVPGLAIKPTGSEELVVTPYATALAAMYEPEAASINFARLAELGGVGPYGYYEAIDFSPSRLPAEARHVIVRSHMAHHQGMTLVALANACFDAVFRGDFAGEAIVQPALLLLEERPPQAVSFFDDGAVEPPPRPHARLTGLPERVIAAPGEGRTEVQALSGGRQGVLITDSGAGYSRFGTAALTRLRDPQAECEGLFIFLREIRSGVVWSATPHPRMAVRETVTRVVMNEHHAQFEREVDGVHSLLDVLIDPQTECELRHLRLYNLTDRVRTLELTSYVEPVLGSIEADRAHPAFSNLFVSTAFDATRGVLIATRRPRAPAETPLSVAHGLVVPDLGRMRLEVETDRALFIGRGRDLASARAFEPGITLSGTVGTVLDPILALRTTLILEPHAVLTAIFTLAADGDPERAAQRASSISQHHAAWGETLNLAWGYARAELQHYGLRGTDAATLQRLASLVLFPGARASAPSTDNLGIETLWRVGLAGDRPYLLAIVHEPSEMRFVQSLLRAYEYLAARGIAFEVAILLERASSYQQDFAQSIEQACGTARLFAARTAGALVFVRGELIDAATRAALEAYPALRFEGSQSLAQQVNRLVEAASARLRPASIGAPAHAVRSAARNPLPKADPDLQFANAIGGFSACGREYRIDEPTPQPWCNVIANSCIGTVVSARGAAFTFGPNAREWQITPWSNDAVSESSAEMCYIEEAEAGWIASPARFPIEHLAARYRVRHGIGYTSFECEIEGLEIVWRHLVDASEPIIFLALEVTNRSSRIRRLRLIHFFELALGSQRAAPGDLVIDGGPGDTSLVINRPRSVEFAAHFATIASLTGGRCTGTDRGAFLGRGGVARAPAGIYRKSESGIGSGEAAVLFERLVTIAPGAAVQEIMMIGWAEGLSAAHAMVRAAPTQSLDARVVAVQQLWDGRLDALTVRTPEPAIDLLVNRWLIYQVLSARLFGRAGFYQAGGAYGFRDQLQDVMALVVAAPELYREHLLRAAARQFEEGDVQHWWHPPAGRGVRTRCSDDRLFLPYAVAHYVKTTGDVAVLDTLVPYLAAPVLGEDEDDRYFAPDEGASATLFDHCVRAIETSLALGAHDLPLIGSGDWNDGMNEVGAAGRGESVWLGWFVIATIDSFALIAEQRHRTSVVRRWRATSARIRKGLDRHGWDGAWYRRAFFDDGTALGTAAATMCRIDSLAQSWAVLAGGVNERSRMAMESAARILPEPASGVIRLLTPPFHDPPQWPGYIAGYPPGVRENGAQYTHAAVWLAWAMLELDPDRGFDLLQAINPVLRTASSAGAMKYGGEAYVLAADVYSEPPHAGRAGWTWYTGAAGWLYRAYVEGLLGLRRVPGGLQVVPRLPTHWPGFEATVRIEETTFNIRVTRGTAHALIVDGDSRGPEEAIPTGPGRTIRSVHRVIGPHVLGTVDASVFRDTAANAPYPGVSP